MKFGTFSAYHLEKKLFPPWSSGRYQWLICFFPERNSTKAISCQRYFTDCRVNKVYLIIKETISIKPKLEKWINNECNIHVSIMMHIPYRKITKSFQQKALWYSIFNSSKKNQQKGNDGGNMTQHWNVLIATHCHSRFPQMR